MISKLSDIKIISGVNSPLLPLVYGDFYYHFNELDGVYIQTINDEMTVVLSLKNNCIDAIKISDKIDYQELESFFFFSKVINITSDFSFNNKNERVCCLLNSKVKSFPQEADVESIDSFSTARDYLGLYSLISENKGGNFPEWYSAFSQKINLNNAKGVYLRINDKDVSGAIAPCIYNSVAVIGGVITSKIYRGLGYATKCVKALVNEINKNNINKIYLWCEKDTVPFYEGVGFEAIGEIYVREGK